MTTFTDWWDRIAAFPIPTAEKAVLQSLARHADWADGTHAYPSIDTMATETSFSPSVVRRALRSLACDDVPDFCQRRRCHHLALIVLTEPARQHRPAWYALTLDIGRAFQMHLPEVSGQSMGTARPVDGRTQGSRSA